MCLKVLFGGELLFQEVLVLGWTDSLLNQPLVASTKGIQQHSDCDCFDIFLNNFLFWLWICAVH